jgi:hypothetical protein
MIVLNAPWLFRAVATVGVAGMLKIFFPTGNRKVKGILFNLFDVLVPFVVDQFDVLVPF